MKVSTGSPMSSRKQSNFCFPFGKQARGSDRFPEEEEEKLFARGRGGSCHHVKYRRKLSPHSLLVLLQEPPGDGKCFGSCQAAGVQPASSTSAACKHILLFKFQTSSTDERNTVLEDMLFLKAWHFFLSLFSLCVGSNKLSLLFFIVLSFEKIVGVS